MNRCANARNIRRDHTLSHSKNAANMLFCNTVPIGCGVRKIVKRLYRVSVPVCHCTSMLALLSRTVIHGKGDVARRTIKLLGRMHIARNKLGTCRLDSFTSIRSFLSGLLRRHKRRFCFRNMHQRSLVHRKGFVRTTLTGTEFTNRPANGVRAGMSKRCGCRGFPLPARLVARKRNLVVRGPNCWG